MPVGAALSQPKDESSGAYNIMTALSPLCVYAALSCCHSWRLMGRLTLGWPRCLEGNWWWACLATNFTQPGWPPSLRQTVSLQELMENRTVGSCCWWGQLFNAACCTNYLKWQSHIMYHVLSDRFSFLCCGKEHNLNQIIEAWQGCFLLQRACGCPEAGFTTSRLLLVLFCATFFESKGKKVQSSQRTQLPLSSHCVIGESTEPCVRACCVRVIGQRWPAKRSQGPHPVCNQAHSTPHWPHSSVCTSPPVSARLGCVRSNTTRRYLWPCVISLGVSSHQQAGLNSKHTHSLVWLTLCVCMSLFMFDHSSWSSQPYRTFGGFRLGFRVRVRVMHYFEMFW